MRQESKLKDYAAAVAGAAAAPAVGRRKLRRSLAVLATVYDELSPFGCLTMARRLFNPVSLLQVAAVAAFILCLVSARERRNPRLDSPDLEDDLLSCPFECDCKGLTVDCANRGLKFVPKNIPSDAKRV